MFLYFKALFHCRPSSNGAFAPRLIRLTSILLFLLSTAIANQPRAIAQDENSVDEVVRVSTDLITVPVFVTDARGRRVGTLLREDFVVRDNGQVVKTEYFASGAERVALLFALDASGSARDIVNQQRETALALFSRFGPGSRVAVLRFTERASLSSPFAVNTSEALAAFNFPALTGSHTAIFDAAWEAVRAFDAKDNAERRIVILISDGLDTASSTTPAKVIDAATKRGVSFYVIHIPLYAPRDGQLRVRQPSRGFRDLAEKTGGKYFLLGDVKAALTANPRYDLAAVFKAIEDDLKGQYLLGYYPAEGARDSLPHRIEVSLAGGNKSLRVKTLRNEYVLKSAP
jgi:Ca-activated chloride channel family protein